MAATLLGWVTPILPNFVYPISWRYCGIYVVFPDPVSATTIITWLSLIAARSSSRNGNIGKLSRWCKISILFFSSGVRFFSASLSISSSISSSSESDAASFGIFSFSFASVFYLPFFSETFWIRPSKIVLWTKSTWLSNRSSYFCYSLLLFLAPNRTTAVLCRSSSHISCSVRLVFSSSYRLWSTAVLSGTFLSALSS